MTDKFKNWVTESDLKTKLFVLFILYGGCGFSFGLMAYLAFASTCK